MEMTFYYFPMSNSTRVHWALEELAVPCKKVRLDLYEKREHRTPEYLKLNPNGKVPLLVVDGQPIWESLAQLLYLGETFGEAKALFPKAGLERAEAFKWLAWFMVSVHANAARIHDNSENNPEEERNLVALRLALRDTTEQLALLDAHLKTHDYVLGKNFSLVDCAIAPSVPGAHHLGLDLTAMTALRAWADRCCSRPAFARAE